MSPTHRPGRHHANHEAGLDAGRVVLVTGASRGIGVAICDAFVRDGYAVTGCGRSPRTADVPADVDYRRCDVSDPKQIRGLVEEVVTRHGRIDVLVNNAGIYEGVGDDASDPDWHAAWARTMGINLQASADLARLAVQHFRERGEGGRIINVASRAGSRGDSPQHWHYAASKGAMIAMTKTIARGYAGQGILAFAVSPGFTVSEMTEEYLAGRGGAAIVADIPLGRVATTDEIAETIRWLATEAPASATGSNIDVNGASYVR